VVCERERKRELPPHGEFDVKGGGGKEKKWRGSRGGKSGGDNWTFKSRQRVLFFMGKPQKSFEPWKKKTIREKKT